MMTVGHLRDVVNRAVLAHFTEDPTMRTANERARAARLLVYVDRHVATCEICEGLHVDSEYSRVGGELTHKELNGHQVFPDLLIHRRTVQSANLLACEVKLRASSRPIAGPDHDDQVRIDMLTGVQDGRPDEMARYEVGLCISLDENIAEGWWTVPFAGLWHEREALASPPSASLLAVADVILPLDIGT